jgi:hypothetical protein
MRTLRKRHDRNLGVALILFLALLPVKYFKQDASAATVVEVAAEESEEPGPEIVTIHYGPAIKTFEESFAKNVGSVSQSAYAPPAAPSVPKEQPAKIRLASLPPITVTAPKPQAAAAKELPKPKPVVAAQPRVRLSSNNWEQMSGYQRWQFVAGFIAANHWSCPPSGMSREKEMEELSKHSWGTVRAFGFNSCTKQS